MIMIKNIKMKKLQIFATVFEIGVKFSVFDTLVYFKSVGWASFWRIRIRIQGLLIQIRIHFKQM
jgi:hypothetical protein